MVMVLSLWVLLLLLPPFRCGEVSKGWWWWWL
jgi:hypothetical protein